MAKRKKKQPPEVIEPKIITNETLEAEALPPVVVASQQEVDVLEALADGKKPQTAMRAAGLSVGKDVAEAYCGGLVRRYNEPMQAALLKSGVTVEKIAEIVYEQLTAQRGVNVKGEGLVMVKDNQAVQGAIGIALDIFPGARAPKKVEHEVRSLEMILLKIQKDDDDE